MAGKEAPVALPSVLYLGFKRRPDHRKRTRSKQRKSGGRLTSKEAPGRRGLLGCKSYQEEAAGKGKVGGTGILFRGSDLNGLLLLQVRSGKRLRIKKEPGAQKKPVWSPLNIGALRDSREGSGGSGGGNSDLTSKKEVALGVENILEGVTWKSGVHLGADDG